MSHRIYSLLRRLAPPDDPSSDAALLLRFARQQDQTAFELLVWRHGGLVLGVCRRVLRDEHLAEDAFQATFLILARKAGSVRGSLPGWLHQVARRVCLRALQRNPVPVEPGSAVGVFDADPLLSAELRTMLDEEIARLPEKQRLAVLLCYLQGRTTDDAAKQLGVPRGTVLSRLDAARKRLQTALTRRGLAVPTVLFTGGLAAPDLPAEVGHRATALAFETSPDLASVPTQLAHEVMHMTTRKAVLGVAAVLVLTAGVGTGVGLVMAQGQKVPEKVADKPQTEQKTEAAKEQPKPTDVELQAKLRARRLEELHRSQDRVSQLIESLERRRLDAVKEAGADVDPSVLQQRLGGIDAEIISTEERIVAWPAEIKELENRSKDMKAGKFDKSGSYAKDVDNFTDRTYESQARKVLNKLKQELDELQKRVSDDNPAVKETQEKMKTVEAEVKKARDLAWAKAETIHQERLKQATEEQLTKNRSRLESDKKELGALRKKRVELVVRIQKAKTALNAQQLIDDEIQVLREIRKQVLRDRLMLEMGSEGK